METIKVPTDQIPLVAGQLTVALMVTNTGNESDPKTDDIMQFWKEFMRLIQNYNNGQDEIKSFKSK